MLLEKAPYVSCFCWFNQIWKKLFRTFWVLSSRVFELLLLENDEYNHLIFWDTLVWKYSRQKSLKLIILHRTWWSHFQSRPTRKNFSLGFWLENLGWFRITKIFWLFLKNYLTMFFTGTRKFLRDQFIGNSFPNLQPLPLFLYMNAKFIS